MPQGCALSTGGRWPESSTGLCRGVSGSPADLPTSAPCWPKTTPCSAKVSHSLLCAPLAITCLEAYGTCLGLPARGVCSPQLESSPAPVTPSQLLCSLHGGTWPLDLVQDTRNPRKPMENHNHRPFLCLNTPPRHCYSIVGVGYSLRWCPSKFPNRK